MTVEAKKIAGIMYAAAEAAKAAEAAEAAGDKNE